MRLDRARSRRAKRHLRNADPVMAAIVRRVGACRFEIDRRGTPYSTLIEAMMYQQITGKAAEAIHRRLRARIGREHPRPGDIASVSDADLRAIGLSRQKIGYLRDLTAKVGNGLTLDRLSRLDDEAVIERLTAVKGIGRWTADMFLMFRLGRLDVLPVGDYGVRKAMQRAYGWRSLPKPKRMRRTAEAWRPYRTIAAWYLWRSIEGAAAFI